MFIYFIFSLYRVIIVFNFKLVLNFNEEFKTLHMHFARALYEALIVRNGRDMDFINDLVEVKKF